MHQKQYLLKTQIFNNYSQKLTFPYIHEGIKRVPKKVVKNFKTLLIIQFTEFSIRNQFVLFELKCTFCQDRIWQGIGGPSCVERCPVGALTWGPRADLLEMGKARVEELKAEGLSSAWLYGETQAGGLAKGKLRQGVWQREKPQAGGRAKGKTTIT